MRKSITIVLLSVLAAIAPVPYNLQEFVISEICDRQEYRISQCKM